MNPKKAIFSTAAVLGLISILPARAGVLDNLRHSIRSLWGQKSEKFGSAREGYQQAHSFQVQSLALHEQLEKTQQELGKANDYYLNLWHQMKQTEGRIGRAQGHLAQVEARLSTHRALFGQRLAAMQRSGKLGTLELLLGSRNLSDLTRRVYLFNAITTHDSELLSALKDDQNDLEETRNQLQAQWAERNRLQTSANQERARIQIEENKQDQMLRQINSNRDASLAYANAEARSSDEIGAMIQQLSARRDEVMEQYQAERPTRRYRHVRVARRVRRIRYVKAQNGELKPMEVHEVVYRDEMVPEAGGLSEGLSQSGDDDGWEMPVRARISSGFGMRYHPILRREKLHTGDDLAAGYGTPFRAAHGGRVLWSGWKTAYGNTIIVDDGHGLTTLYGHASRLNVRAGQTVKRGDTIGNVGSTGWSTGPHLHFEMRKDGKPIDPTPYLHGR